MPGQVPSVPESKLYTLGTFFSHFICNLREIVFLYLQGSSEMSPTVSATGGQSHSPFCRASAHHLESSWFHLLLSYCLFPKASQRSSWKMSAKSRHSPALHFRERTNSCSTGSDRLWLLTSNLALMSPSPPLLQQNACFAISQMCCPLSL